MTPFWIGIALGALLGPMLLVVLLGVIGWFLRGTHSAILTNQAGIVPPRA
jgi:hypothetical protein